MTVISTNAATAQGGLRRFVLDVMNDPGMLDGALSLDYGFLPRTAPLHALPPAYAVWDAMAARLAELNTAAAARAALAGLPVLDAEALPESCLARAATILSQFALSWWRGEPELFFALRMGAVGADLPDSILRPWRQVSRRLGRDDVYQSGYDLFLNNFRLADGIAYEPAALVIENLQPLVPSFGNSAERVFYMAFVEMMGHCVGLVEAACRVEEAMAAADPDAMAELLAVVTRAVEKCIATFRRISPRQGSPTWCDPLLWAKTVAILAVSPHPWRQGGTSGSFVPVFLVLDALLGRTAYGSYYGRYLRDHAPGLLPAHLLDFTRRVAELGLRAWLEERRDQPGFDRAVAAFDALVDAYAGEAGYLGRHVSKVLNYLAVATMVGRNQSTSGDERFTHQHTWVQVAAHMEAARDERLRLRLNAAPPEPDWRPEEPPPGMPAISELEVAESALGGRPLHAIHGLVYDLNPYLARHPGGTEIVAAYGGLDATPFFSLGREHTAEASRRQMRECLAGRLGDRLPDQPAARALTRALYSRNILRLHADSMGTEAAPRPETTAEQRGHFARHAHMQFVHEHLPAILGAWDDDPAARALARRIAARRPEDDFARGSRAALARDMALLEDFTRAAITALRGGAPLDPVSLEAALA